MKTPPEKIAELKALVHKLNNDADDHMGVAHSTDMPPQHTVNFRHAKNAHEAAWAITNLIADLEEANARADAAGNMSRYNATCRESLREELADVRKQLEEATAARGNGVLVPSPKLKEMQAEIRALRQQLAEAQDGEARGKVSRARLIDTTPCTPESVERQKGFIRWIDSEWQYDEVDL